MKKVLCNNIEGLPGYHVTRHGKVYSYHRTNGNFIHVWKERKLKLGTNGRLVVVLKGKNYSVSRLVAKAWVPNPYNKPFVCHIDNNPLNNDYRNLYWGTHKENMEQMVNECRSTKGRKLSESHRLMLKGPRNSIRGELHYKSKLTNSQRIDIINYWLEGSYSLNKLSGMYNVSRKCIRSIINRGIDFYKI